MSISFLLLQTVNKKVNDLSVKLDYSEPKIYTGGVDIKEWSKLSKKQQKEALDKSWFIYFSYRDPKTGRLKRQPHIKAGVNRFKTKRDRYKLLKVLCKSLSELLSYGFNPYEDNTDLEQKLRGEEPQPQPKPSKPEPLPTESAQFEEAEDGEYTVAEAIEFGLSLKENMMKHNSYLKYKSRIRQFEKWLKKHHDLKSPISTVTKKAVNLYLNDVFKKTSARNRNNSRTDIASLFQLLEDNEVVAQNFVKVIPKLKTKPTRNKTYTSEQEKKIFKYLEQKDINLLLMIKFISYNFLRPIEVCRLKIKDVDLENKRLYVKAKNQPVKIKIIPDILLKDIPDLSNKSPDAFLIGRSEIGKKWTATDTNRRSEYSKRFKAVKDHFNLGKEFGLYSFRHTFITKLYRKLRENLSPFETKSKLKLITGHSTMTALEKYLRDIDAELPEDYSNLLE